MCTNYKKYIKFQSETKGISKILLSDQGTCELSLWDQGYVKFHFETEVKKGKAIPVTGRGGP
jgi:hypothetical protein